MSAREWQPGDVAVATLGDGSKVFVVRTKDSCHLCVSQSTSHWHGQAGNLPGNYPDVRPLVVIDPEDVEQVERLHEALGWIHSSEDRLVAALRSLIAPPRPKEPTGFGAVVEDATGAYWTLYAPKAGVFINYREGKRLWGDIAAVRVLTEGVTA